MRCILPSTIPCTIPHRPLRCPPSDGRLAA
jgi:hypothetical protein